MEGEANMAYQPFYIMNAQNQEENWEVLEEKDWNYIKDMYPQMAKSIQEKVDEECDKLEYDGSMMFDEYPDKLMIRNICERIYKEMQEQKGRELLYAEDEEKEFEAEVYPVNQNSSVNMPAENEWNMDMSMETATIEENRESVQSSQICTPCQKHSLQSANWGRPPQGGPGFPPPRPPQGGPGFPPPRPPQVGPGFPPPRPPHGGPGFPPPRPPQVGPGFPPLRPPQGPGWVRPRPCSCPPGRPCRDCLIALQNQPDWMRDMIEVLLYQEMMHRRRRRRRRRQYQRNYD